MLTARGDMYTGWFTGRTPLSAKLRCRKSFIRHYGPLRIGRPKYSVRRITRREWWQGRPRPDLVPGWF